ncbi:hypothetical protein Tco_1092214 [Tanacetum coccineum]|uniref:Uncharacterized protein n=1 Tax=Tanacetum coccineum TaxID=301880 RepID=A0ABQ5I9B2_9ASTR
MHEKSIMSEMMMTIMTGLQISEMVSIDEVDDTSGKGLSNIIVNEIKIIGLDLDEIRGQDYDNVFNMKGLYSILWDVQQEGCSERVPNGNDNGSEPVSGYQQPATSGEGGDCRPGGGDLLYWYIKHQKDINHGLQSVALAYANESSVLDVSALASEAMNCFSKESKHAEAGYGPVYKGKQEITVKRLCTEKEEKCCGCSSQLNTTQLWYHAIAEVEACFKWVWRFLTDGSSLWTRFIKAIIGNKGALDTHKFIHRRSPWQDVILAIHSLQRKGEVALKVLYKRFYALEMCKSISVAEKMGHPFLSYSFRRMPRGGVEQENYGLLCSKVADLLKFQLDGLESFPSRYLLRDVVVNLALQKSISLWEFSTKACSLIR